MIDDKLKVELTDGSLSSKDWWHKVNTLSGKKATFNISVLKDQDQAYTTASEKAEVLGQIFVGKCQLDRPEEPAPDIPQATQHKLLKIVFMAKDIKRLLRKLKPNEDTGTDNIPTRVLKECSAELA